MAAKPADFFVGVIDFFAILLPGAILEFAGLNFARQHILGTLLPYPEGKIAGWAAFAIAAYVLGHFCSQLGAAALDKIYDCTFLKIWKRGEGDQLFKYAKTILSEKLGAQGSVARPFQWARTHARLRSAPGIMEIDRLEADSKFFRSMTVVLLIYSVVVSIRTDFPWHFSASVLLFAFALFSFWRFSDLRWKCGEAAFLTLVALEKFPGKEKGTGATV